MPRTEYYVMTLANDGSALWLSDDEKTLTPFLDRVARFTNAGLADAIAKREELSNYFVMGHYHVEG
jgi:hypothetical protein